MSLYIKQSCYFTLRPSIRETKSSIIIKTGFLTKLYTLFFYTQKIEIIPSIRKIKISKTFAWVFPVYNQLDFDDVWYIEYAFKSSGTDWGYTSSGYKNLDEMEKFSILLVTKNEKKHFVCSFSGEGAVSTGWSGILIGHDDIIDYEGTQENESKQFVEYLCKILDVTLGKPIPESIPMKECPECTRETSPYSPKCLYCGAKLTKE